MRFSFLCSTNVTVTSRQLGKPTIIESFEAKEIFSRMDITALDIITTYALMIMMYILIFRKSPEKDWAVFAKSYLVVTRENENQDSFGEHGKRPNVYRL